MFNAPNGETVTLEDASNGNAVVGSGTLTNGAATINVSSLAAGSHNIFAVYGGDTNLSGSQSGQVSQVVTLPIMINSIVANGNPSAAAARAITSISEGFNPGDSTNDLVTVTTAGNNGFVTENLVSIAGFSAPNAGYNGAYNITVTSPTTFTYVDPNSTTLASLNNTGTASSALVGNQRSMVASLVYVFNQPVNLVASPTATFSLALTPNVSINSGPPTSTVGTIPTLHWSNPSGDQVTWVVTFSGSGVQGGGSIADGVYNITLNNADVSPVTGTGTLAASDTETFYRLAGDALGYLNNGNEAVVTTADYNQAKNAFTSGPLPGQPLYRAYFDFLGSGTLDVIATADFNQVKTRFTNGLTYSSFTPTI
jgi:hypothetical protein